jgi:hypothetical protein
MTDKIKVCISGIHYPLSMMSYFIRAFQRREDVEMKTAGPFTGEFIPWGGGMRIAAKYIRHPDVSLPQGWIGQPGMSASPIEVQLPWIPDLWLQVDAGWWVQRPRAKVVAHVATDPHVLDYSAQRRTCDVFFNMQTPYLQSGDHLLPYAYDPTVHFPMEIQKETDGCLIGLHYEQRDRLVNQLRAEGFSVHYSIGEIFDENRILYNKSRVALSWSSLRDTPARVFEAVGMGVPLLANRTPDLQSLFVEGRHYLGFDSLSEAVLNFKLLISDLGLRAEMSRNQLEIAKEHTWDSRVEKILSVCNLI